MSRIMLATLCAVALTSAPVLAKPKHCPPGLAKKSPACVPPGQVGKSVSRDDRDRYDRDDEWYGDRYDRVRAGDRIRLDGQDYTVVRSDDGRVVLRRNDRIYRLPQAGDGSDYVRVGDALVRVDRQTRDVLEWIRLTDLIFG